MFIRKNDPKAVIIDAVLISNESKDIIQRMISDVKKITVFNFNNRLCNPQSIISNIGPVLTHKGSWLVIPDISPKRVWILDSIGFNTLYEPYLEPNSLHQNELITTTDTINSVDTTEFVTKQIKQPTPKTRRPRRTKTIQQNSSQPPNSTHPVDDIVNSTEGQH